MNSFGQENIEVFLKDSKSNPHLPFIKTQVSTFSTEQPGIYIVPTFNFKEYCIRYYYINRFQYWYNEYLNQIIDTNFFNKVYQYYKFDTTILSNKFIHCFFSILIGVDKTGKKKIILDENNNLNFCDDSVYDFQEIINGHRDFAIKNILIYEKGSVFKRSIFLNIVKDTYIPKDKGCLTDSTTIATITNNIMAGEFLLLDNKYYCYIQHDIEGLTFNSKLTKFYIFPESDLKKNNHEEFLPFKLYDTIYLEKVAYLIKYCSVFGDTLVLQRLFEDKYNFGFSVNDYLKNDSSFNELNNVKTSLSTVKTDYKVLDFWGSWCVPCEEALPVFKSIVTAEKRKRRKFSFYSIALEYNNSPEKAREKIETGNMYWHNIVEYPDSDLSLNKSLRVNTYPTFIILDKNNKIIFRESGKDKVYELKKFIESL